MGRVWGNSAHRVRAGRAKNKCLVSGLRARIQGRTFKRKNCIQGRLMGNRASTVELAPTFQCPHSHSRGHKRKEGRFPASLIYTPCALPLTFCTIRGEFLYTLCTLNTSSGWCRATSFASSRVEQIALASPPFFKLRI